MSGVRNLPSKHRTRGTLYSRSVTLQLLSVQPILSESTKRLGAHKKQKKKKIPLGHLVPVTAASRSRFVRIGIASTEAEDGGDPISNPGLLFRKRSLLFFCCRCQTPQHSCSLFCYPFCLFFSSLLRYR